MTAFTTGDTSPALTGTVNTNLTGATVELHLRRPDSTVLIRVATVTNPVEGGWSYQWMAGDLNAPDVWDVEAQVTYSNGRIQTFGPARFNVTPQIA